jgi:hypothetical protein
MIKKVEDVTIKEWKAIYPKLKDITINIDSTKIFIRFEVINHLAERMWDCLNVHRLNDSIDTDERIPEEIYTEDDWEEVDKYNA